MKYQHKLLVVLGATALLIAGLFTGCGNNEVKKAQYPFRYTPVYGTWRSSTTLNMIEIDGQKFLVIDNSSGLAIVKF